MSSSAPSHTQLVAGLQGSRLGKSVSFAVGEKLQYFCAESEVVVLGTIFTIISLLCLKKLFCAFHGGGKSLICVRLSVCGSSRPVLSLLFRLSFDKQRKVCSLLNAEQHVSVTGRQEMPSPSVCNLETPITTGF